MILQCEQCNTRFRLDDSKLKPGGVKVRCSKCRHVFVAGAEQASEETDFDAILSGLGAPAPERGQAAPSAEPPAFGAGAAEAGSGHGEAERVGAEDSGIGGLGDLGKAAPAAQNEASFDDFSFEFEPAKGAAEAAGAPSAPADLLLSADKTEAGPAAGRDVAALAEFNFDFEEPSLPEEKVEPPAAATGGLDFSEFEFKAEPEPSVEGNPPSSAPDALDFGELAFDEEPAQAVFAAATQESPLNFREFEFEPVSAPQDDAALAVQEEGLDFDFSFDEPARNNPVPATGAAAGAGGPLDFGEISFDTAPLAVSPAAAGQGPAPVEFGDISFDAEPAEKSELAQPGAGLGNDLDLGEFSFEDDDDDFAPLQESSPAETGAAAADVTAAASYAAPARGGVALDAAAASSFDLGLAQPAGATQRVSEAETHPVEPSFADFAGTGAAAGAAKGKVGAFSAEAGDPERRRFSEPVFAAHAHEGDEYLDEGELPPLSISSRRKGRSLMTASVVAVSLLAIAGLSGAGFYLLKSGPAAFDRLGLGFVPSWFGIQNQEEGKIMVRNPSAAFHQNQEAGELFVVTGQAVNEYKKPRASIHVRVTLFDKSGKAIMQKSAYCGNVLSDQQLTTLPMAKIDAAMNNQFGDSLSNLGVKPGGQIPFVVAIANVPKEAADFGVDVTGSTVAAQ